MKTPRGGIAIYVDQLIHTVGNDREFTRDELFKKYPNMKNNSMFRRVIIGGYIRAVGTDHGDHHKWKLFYKENPRYKGPVSHGK